MGFNVTGGKMLTAGHCTRGFPAWRKQHTGTFVGPSIASNFPVTDFGLIRNDGGLNQPGEVTTFDAGDGIQEIDGADWPTEGQIVCKSGEATHVTCGQVTETNVTIGFPGGTVWGLAETLACAAEGDSGGPLYQNRTALGLTVGVTSGFSCSQGGFRSYFQPVIPALQEYRVQLIVRP